MSTERTAEKNGIPSQLDPETATPVPSKPPQYPEGGLHGWLTVAGCFTVMFCTFGYINAFGVYQAYYKQHFLQDKSESDIAWIGSLQAFFMLGSGLISGGIADRYGPKIVLYPCSLIYVVSIMLTSLCTKYYQFVLAQGVLGGFFNGMTFTPAVAIIGHYFMRRRPLAMAIASSGSSLGGVIYPIMLNRLLNHTDIGFGWSIRIVGFLTLALSIVTCTCITPRVPPREGPHFLIEAWKHPAYTLQVIGLFFVLLGLMVPFFYISAFAEAHGLTVEYSFYLVAILNGPSIVGRILSGSIANHIGRFNTQLLNTTICGILCFCWLRTESKSSITAFTALYGFFSGSVIGLFPTTLAMTAPAPNKIGTYMGMGLGFLSLAMLTGTPITGAMISRYGRYNEAIIFSGAVMMGGTVLLVGAKIAFTGKKLIS